jgi:hypothetical protein
MFEVVSKVVLSAPKALQTTGLDLVNIGPFYGSKPSQNPLTSELPSYHLNSGPVQDTARIPKVVGLTGRISNCAQHNLRYLSLPLGRISSRPNDLSNGLGDLLLAPEKYGDQKRPAAAFDDSKAAGLMLSRACGAFESGVQVGPGIRSEIAVTCIKLDKACCNRLLLKGTSRSGAQAAKESQLGTTCSVPVGSTIHSAEAFRSQKAPWT